MTDFNHIRNSVAILTDFTNNFSVIQKDTINIISACYAQLEKIDQLMIALIDNPNGAETLESCANQRVAMLKQLKEAEQNLLELLAWEESKICDLNIRLDYLNKITNVKKGQEQKFERAQNSDEDILLGTLDNGIELIERKGEKYYRVKINGSIMEVHANA